MKALLLSVLMLLGCAAGANAANPATDPLEATPAELGKKLERLVVPEVQYHEATLKEITRDLAVRSKALDPDKAGFTVTLTPAAEKTPSTITLSLRNVPMIELIKYVTNLSNLKYRLTKDNVVVFDALK
jgi:hypothetical protein